jgi:uncharacterized protein (DUF934 family)
MALLEAGRLVEDRFPVIVSLDELKQAPAEAVRVPGATPAAELAPFLPALKLVVVEFPKFRDGRGFTLGRTLRERYGFTGEIRAAGHILPDQHVLLLRCGFTGVELPEGADPAVWQAALGRYHVAYQPAMTADSPLARHRRRLTLG